MPVFFSLTEHAKVLAEHRHELIPVSGDRGIIVQIMGIALEAETKLHHPVSCWNLCIIHVI